MLSAGLGDSTLIVFRVGLHRRHALQHGLKAEPPSALCGSTSCIPLPEGPGLWDQKLGEGLQGCAVSSGGGGAG